MDRLLSSFLKRISPDPGKERRGWGFLYNLLRAPTFEDASKNRVASLQHKILLIIFIVCLLALLVFLLALPGSDAFIKSSVWQTSFTIISLVPAFILMRRGHTEYVSWMIVGITYLAFTISFFVYGYIYINAIMLILVIALAGLLLHYKNVIIVSGIALLSPLVLNYIIAPSLAISTFELMFILLMVGLAGLLISLAAQSLEQSFDELNKNQRGILRHNELLIAASEIAYAATRTTHLDTLLATSVKLLREKFEFYHVSLFLIEPGSNIAVLRASSGEAGHTLKVNEHQLAIGSQSLIGSATESHQPVVVQDVTKEPAHLKNPTLPDTQAEAVIPMLIGDNVIGALDVQSRTAEAFSDWDITTLTTIANQLAIAVQNIRLYGTAQQEITDRRRAEQELLFAKEALELRVEERTAQLSEANEQLNIELTAHEKSEVLFRSLFELSPDAVLLMDPHDPDTSWPIIDCNEAACLMNGYSRDELIGHSIDMLNENVDTQSGRSNFFKRLREAGNLKYEINHRHNGGDLFPIETATALITIGGRELVLGIDRDISEHKQAQAELEQSLSTLSATLEATADGILVVDQQGKVVNFNQRFTKMWNIPDSTLASREDDQALAFVVNQLSDPKAFMTKVHELYAHVEEESFDMLLLKDGRIFERYSRPQQIGDKSVGRVWSFRDVTERRQAEEKLAHTALHDPLTNLPNRVLFMDRLHHAMVRAKRHTDRKFAVLFLDLDRFKVVNDSLGHKIGDLLLVECTQRMVKCLRGEDTVARLGGDEFVILLEDVQDPMDATRVADRIQHDLALPFDLEDRKVFISVSIGVVLNMSQYEKADDILRDADIAMYRAKGQGRGRYEMFDSTMLAHVMTHLELEFDLRKALEQNEFIVHYQPIIKLGTGRIVGFEALVRWKHPTRGLVSPAEFIPLAEETGLIVPLGHWVLAEACRQIGEWHAEFPVDPPLTISVNLSVRQCAQTDFVQKVADILQKTGVDASHLKLELTESMIVEDSQSTSTMLSELRALGVQVQIDDFGTGYSSLGYLQRFPIDTLKIDRTFINRIGKNGEGSEIVRTILALAHDLHMKVVAEGIETEEQLTKLKAMNCEYGQGYLFNKPIDSQMAGALLAKSFTEVKV